MARASLPPLLERVREAPWRFGFLSLLRRLAAQPAAPADGVRELAAPAGAATRRIGRALRPRHETFRLGQVADLAFAPREIAEVVLPPSSQPEPAHPGAAPLAGNLPTVPLVRVFGLGLLGPNGPLPLHYTEWVRERSRNHRDGTLANFLDVFHHRYLTLLYRAWAQGQAAAGLDRRDDETFSGYIGRLTGHEPSELRGAVLPAHARLSASAHLSQESRHPDGLVQTLVHFFQAPILLQEFVLHWIAIDAADHSRLGDTRASSVLAGGAIAGERVPDRQGRFCLVLGPLTLERYLRFMPGGADLPVLREWVRAFMGFEFAWQLELRVRADDAPPARLEEGHRLGWSTWLGDARCWAGRCGDGPATDAVGLVFEPESCALPPAGTAPAPGAPRDPAVPVP